MNAIVNQSLNLTARDVTGQRRFAITFRSDGTIRELVQSVLPKMGLDSGETNDKPQIFRAFLEREGRHLHGAERAEDCLREADEITLQPDIQAGGK